MRRLVSLVSIVASFCTFAQDPLPAFPGAEGFGAVAVGGRGGRVIKVTNLNSSGPGSLAAACAERGPRIVVFEVGGVIRGDIEIKYSNLTIAGQSAPAPGITLVGRILARSADNTRMHDIVIRFLRLRPPPAIGVDGDAIQLPMTERVMLDHLSLAWSNDEMIDIIHSSEVSVQWSTIEESDPTGHAKGVPHNYAILSAYPGSGNISIHHNLFAHHSRRLPSISPQVEDKPDDFRNNVIYNFRDGLSHEGHEPKAAINVIGNYYKRGPNAALIHPFQLDATGSYYLSDNYFDGFGVVNDPRRADAPHLPFWIRSINGGTVLPRPAPVAPIITHGSQEAFALVLARAGAWPRDRITLRTLSEVRDGAGKWGRNAPAHPSDEWLLDNLGQENADRDRDGDGMPDRWERQHGLNPKNSRDHARRMPSSYTAIEDYLNARAGAILEGAGQSDPR